MGKGQTYNYERIALPEPQNGVPMNYGVRHQN